MLLTHELIFFTVLCLIGTQGKPSLSFNLHPFQVFNGFGAMREDRDAVKKYSGIRVSNDSLRQVYFNEQTVAIVELAEHKRLLNCEFIEVYKNEDAVTLLYELQKLAKPVHIGFPDMVKLMSQCTEVENNNRKPARSQSVRSSGLGKGLFTINPLTLLSGIIPGTKWCGTGDIADHYHDLGQDDADRCCRAHDLCPVKVRGYAKRYNITNMSYYTKSHCQCDERLFECLKTTTGPTSHILGNVYFNLLQVPCVEDLPDGRKEFRDAKNNF